MENIIRVIIFSFTFFLELFIVYCECDINYPILTKNGCELKYCTDNDFISGECSINNTIIKNQWLNNIIYFDFDKLRYGSFATNKEGDMIFECSVEEKKGTRVFYGLKKNGSYFFKDEQDKEIPTKIIIIKNGNTFPVRYEAQILFITINNKEYLISIGLYESMVELYDFENDETNFVSTYDFTGFNIHSTVSTLMEFQNQYYYTFIGREKDNTFYNEFRFVLQKYSFTDNKINLNYGYICENKINFILGNLPRVSSSCIINSNLIIFFYHNKILNQLENYVIDLYNENLEKKFSKQLNEYTIGNYNDYVGLFNKCIYIKNNLGAFIFYLTNENSYPILLLMEINSNDINKKEEIKLNWMGNLISEPLLNDIIKINDKRFTFITSSFDRDKLFIVLFEFYNNDRILKARTYQINMLALYNINIYRELSSILYNNFITLSLSACNTSPCDKEIGASEYFSLLIIFGYSNGTNLNINISHYLSEFIDENNIDENNIIDKILENTTIDNNIFGYEFEKKIRLVSIPYELIFYNIINNEKKKVNINETLDHSYEIVQNQSTIKNSNETYHFEFQCILKWSELNDQYSVDTRNFSINNTDNIEENENTESDLIYGKTIKTEFKLCYELCNTCEYLGVSFDNQKCLTCFDNYTLYKGNCYPGEITDFITTDLINNETTCLSYFYSKRDNQCLEYCSYEDLLNDNCGIKNCPNKNALLYNLFKNYIIDEYTGTDNLILESDSDYIFQLTNSLNEKNTKNGKNSNNYNLSMIDLQECEDTLKEVNHIDKNLPLIIYKLERIGTVASQKNIQYEIYNPETKEILDLSVCSEKITIYIPVKLNEETLELQQDLLSYGYDLFNPNDSFYQDICAGYTSSNGTDVLLSDRRKYYYNDTETACQEECIYSEYSVENEQLKCECSVSNEEIEPEKDIKFDGSMLFSSFYDVLKYSNFFVLKCYKLVFSFQGQKHNWGSMIIIGYFAIYSIFNALYFIKGYFYVKLYSAKMIFNNNSKKNNNNIFNHNNNEIQRRAQRSKSFVFHNPPRKKFKSKTRSLYFQKDILSSEKHALKQLGISKEGLNLNLQDSDSSRKIKQKNEAISEINDTENNMQKINIEENSNKENNKQNNNIQENNIQENIILPNYLEEINILENYLQGKNIQEKLIIENNKQTNKVQVNNSQGNYLQTINQQRNNLKGNNLQGEKLQKNNMQENYLIENNKDVKELVIRQKNKNILNKSKRNKIKRKTFDNSYQMLRMLENINNVNSININSNEKIINFNENEIINNFNNINNNSINVYKRNSNRSFSRNSNSFLIEFPQKKNLISYFKGNNFSDFELNELPYFKAVQYDKRTFLYYYWQLIRREHLIIFTFFAWDDNNILTIKLSKFIFALALDFAVNIVFFVDDSMHKIYLDYGKYSFVAQIPQILYSTLASEGLDVFLRYLCLIEKDIYKIKKLEKRKNKVLAKKQIFEILKLMRIKLICYFFFTFFFMCFFWYFVSAFCAVYKNTQIFLIKDSFSSFLMSLLYPFVLYLFPTALRILSLKDQKKRLKFLYKLSDIIPLI